MFETARRHGAGVFVLALTSNPEGSEVQGAVRDGRTVAGAVLDQLRELNRESVGPLGSFGAVVGATLDQPAEDLDIGGPLLAPGYGAQGGTVADLRRIFGSAAAAVLPSTSREVLRHGPYITALRDAALRGNDEVASLGA